MSVATDSLPEEAFAAALASLPGMTSARLSRVLACGSARRAWLEAREGNLARLLTSPVPGEDGGAEAEPAGLFRGCMPEPSGAGRRARAGRLRVLPGTARVWQEAAAALDIHRLWARYEARGVEVRVLGRPGYPRLLGADREAPPVVFMLGQPSVLEHRRVAVVGTRSATHYGEDVATDLGHGLARSGVAVVSGLARGIDRAAHDGALAAGGCGPLGVTGSGLDVPYPRSSASTWARVAESGLLLTESPLGCGPEAWRFPLRNRIIAALAEVVVVVECHRWGGAMITVEAASTRGVEVMAVPGSVRSAASVGTNGLIADGAAPVRDVDDVLVALGLRTSVVAAATLTSRLDDVRGVEATVLGAVDWEPTATGAVLARTGLDLGEVSVALGRLADRSLVRRCDASPGWWERVAGLRRAEPAGPR